MICPSERCRAGQGLISVGTQRRAVGSVGVTAYSVLMANQNHSTSGIAIPVTMKAVVTVGSDGYDQLVYREMPVPELKAGAVLVQVLAAGINNTEINTRLGWYSAAVISSTEDTVTTDQNRATQVADGGWNEPTQCPLIQGTDCCGRIVAVAPDVDGSIIGTRVLVRPCVRPSTWFRLDRNQVDGI